MPSAPTPTIEITLAGLRFHVRVGILPHERELAQPLEIDLAVTRAPETRGVLDYRDVHAAAARVIEAAPIEYLETAARDIHAALLALDGVTWARVALRKPHVALGGPLDYAEVVVQRDASA